jgi:hypothetical protein
VRLLKCRYLRYQDNMNEDKTNDGKVEATTGGDGLAAPGRTVFSESERRRARAAAKLKENLSRRKQQVRARRAGEADETDGLPAAKELDALPAAKMDEL